MRICKQCLEAIQSHGEKPIVCDVSYVSEEEAIICEWCEEITEEIIEIIL